MHISKRKVYKYYTVVIATIQGVENKRPFVLRTIEMVIGYPGGTEP